jgi:hypothetical protein
LGILECYFLLVFYTLSHHYLLVLMGKLVVYSQVVLGQVVYSQVVLGQVVYSQVAKDILVGDSQVALGDSLVVLGDSQAALGILVVYSQVV